LGGVVFIDEAEQLLGNRSGSMNSHAEDQKITNTFLTGLTQEDQNFIVILTTNRRDNIDDAILRPGRIDEKFKIGMPDIEARLKILKVKVAEIPHELTGDHIKTIAKKTEGWSGADLENLIDRAKIEAANRKAKYLELQDITEAFKQMGSGHQ
jgi:SpoVK/Ycf46/Vps4 family AAA+-type ATPase